MCDLTQGFKLCTCDADELSPSDVQWVLERKNQEKPMAYRKGRAAIPKFSEDEEQVRNEIIKQLDAQSCLDFEYSPQIDDRLRILYQGIWLTFRYKPKGWQKDNSTSLDGWRAQLEWHQSGKIKSAK